MDYLNIEEHNGAKDCRNCISVKHNKGGDGFRPMRDSSDRYMTDNGKYSLDIGIDGANSAKSRDTLFRTIYSRITFLQESIYEINQPIDERQKLKESIISKIEQKVCDVQSIIYGLELDMCGVIDKSSRRISLEKQIGELYKEKRHQKLSHWQDTAKLKHEKRKVEKELRSAMLDLWMVRLLP